MKLFTRLLPALLLAMGIINQSQAQEQARHDLGTADSFRKTLTPRASIGDLGDAGKIGVLQVEVAQGKTLDIALNVERQNGPNSTTFIGTVVDVPHSNFNVEIDGGTVTGNIVLGNDEESEAYVYTSDATGHAFVAATPIDEVICVGYDAGPEAIAAPAGPLRSAAQAIVSLQSLPGADACIYLDFDGEVVEGTLWEGGRRIDAKPTNVTDEGIEIFWARVAEDFEPFDVNVTTDLAVFESYQKSRSMQCIITSTNFSGPGVVGVAYGSTFNRSDGLPCFVFQANPSASLAASHEIGHTIGLSHDGRTSPSEPYYGGTRLWGPIMGNPFGTKVSHWSKGDYGNANNLEDDLEIITSRFIPYRADDHGNDRGSATALSVNADGEISPTEGFIGKPSDVDFFSFRTGGGDVTLDVKVAPQGADLNSSVSLYRANGSLIEEFNGGDNLATRVETTLAAGEYFFSIDGIGYKNPRTDGYSDYGSMGFFEVSGNVSSGGGGDPDPEPNQAPTVSIATPTNGATFEAGTTIAVEADAADADGEIATVVLFLNGEEVATELRIPYEYRITDAPVGDHELVAVATDDDGATTTSATVNITVRGAGNPDPGTNQAPTVSIATPTNGATFEAGTTIAVEADAADADGEIATVVLFLNGKEVATERIVPYEYRITSAPVGDHELVAVATDDDGATTTSATVTITVQDGGNDEGVATLYADCAYGGKSLALAEGRYSQRELTALGFRDNSLSAIKVTNGYVVYLYSGGYFRGNTAYATEDDPCFVDDRFDNVVSSVVVRKVSTRSNKIEAEDFTWSRGVGKPESMSGTGGGSVTGIDAGDWLAFDRVTFPTTSYYLVEYRVSSTVDDAELSLNLNRGRHRLGNVSIPNTGDANTYTTVTDTVWACAGTYMLGLYSPTGGWNIDWLRVTPIDSKNDLRARSDDDNWDPESEPLFADEEPVEISIFPNPVAYDLQIEVPTEYRDGELSLFDQRGALLWSGPYQDRLDVSAYPSGMYALVFKRGSFQTTKRFVKE